MIKLCTHFILCDAHINNRDVLKGNTKKAYNPVSTCSQSLTFYITFDKIKKYNYIIN